MKHQMLRGEQFKCLVGTKMPWSREARRTEPFERDDLVLASPELHQRAGREPEPSTNAFFVYFSFPKPRLVETQSSGPQDE